MRFDFLNENHKERFLEIQNKMAVHYQNNKEYLSVVYIMAGDEELYRKFTPYFDTAKGLFHSEEMFQEEDFSSGMRVLAKLAVHLFNSNETVSPLDLIRLDDGRLKLALNAILSRRYGLEGERAFN